jgi:hypothetical protein
MIYALETELAPWALNALIVIWGVIMAIAFIILLLLVIHIWRDL